MGRRTGHRGWRGSDVSLHPDRRGGFHPAAGLAAVAELGTDGRLLRLTLPGHPVRPEPAPARPFGWASVLAAVELESERRTVAGGVRSGSTRGRAAHRARAARGRHAGRDALAGAHLLLREQRAPDAGRWNGGSLPSAGPLPGGGLGAAPGRRAPAEERRLLGPEATDPWGPTGRQRGSWSGCCARRSSEAARIWCWSTRAVWCSRRTRRGAAWEIRTTPESRPFGAFIDWALTAGPGATGPWGWGWRAARISRSKSSTRRARWSWTAPSRRSSSRCHLQVRGARLLDDGEVFYVPKDVRIGPRGASASARTGYKYVVARSPAQPASGDRTAAGPPRSRLTTRRKCARLKRAPMTGKASVTGASAVQRSGHLGGCGRASRRTARSRSTRSAPGWTRRRRR